MNTKRSGVTAVGIGAAACAACCAGPIFGLLAAIGIGTVAGVVLFGVVGLLVALIGVMVILTRQRRRTAASPCGIAPAGPVDVPPPMLKGP